MLLKAPDVRPLGHLLLEEHRTRQPCCGQLGALSTFQPTSAGSAHAASGPTQRTRNETSDPGVMQLEAAAGMLFEGLWKKSCYLRFLSLPVMP